MPSFRLNITTTQKGEIFKASATKAAAQRMVTGINDALAQETVNRILQRLGHVLQNPTGYYESRIMIDRGQTYRGVNDSGVVYGGWLEGISSRNTTTRFKGYHTFDTVRKEMAQAKEQIAAPLVEQFVKELS